MLKIFFLVIGFFSLGLGVLGLFLPLIPTTPFLLLSAYCFMKSSNKLYEKLINHKYLGIYIKNYYEKKGIPLKTKIFVISLLWISIGYSVLMVVDKLIVQIVLLLIACIVTIHITRQKTLRTKNV